MSAAKLKAQCLGSPADSILATCHEDAELVGHVFVATWTYEGGDITIKMFGCFLTDTIHRKCLLGHSTHQVGSSSEKHRYWVDWPAQARSHCARGCFVPSSSMFSPM